MKWRLFFAVAVLCVVALWRPVAALSDNSELQEKVPLEGVTLERGCPECNGGDRLQFVIPPISFCVNCPPHRAGSKCEECTGLWWPHGDCSQWLNAEEIQLLPARVTAAEGKIKGNSNDITSLRAIVNTIAANQTVINSELRNWGFSFLTKPAQLTEPNKVHYLADVVPLGTTEVVVQVVVKARFAKPTGSDNCGLRVHVNGLQSQYVETYEAFPGASTVWLRETAFLTMPVDLSDPILTWGWEVTKPGCYDVETTEVNVLGAFRGGRSLSV